MTAAAMSTGLVILSLAGLLLGLVLALAVIALFNRVVRPAAEIDRYAGDILAGGIGIAENLDGVNELARTRDLARAVPGLAGTYLEQLRSRPS